MVGIIGQVFLSLVIVYCVVSKLALCKALNCLACSWLGQPVSTWQVEMGCWPDIHWLARDYGGLLAAILRIA
jgi:hypothetical protein